MRAAAAGVVCCDSRERKSCSSRSKVGSEVRNAVDSDVATLPAPLETMQTPVRGELPLQLLAQLVRAAIEDSVEDDVRLLPVKAGRRVAISWIPRP